MTEQVVDLREFVKQSFEPLASQIAGAGMPDHLVVIDCPRAGLLRIYSGLAPKDRAVALEQLADNLKKAAAEIRKQPGGNVFVPGATKLDLGAKS